MADLVQLRNVLNHCHAHVLALEEEYDAAKRKEAEVLASMAKVMGKTLKQTTVKAFEAYVAKLREGYENLEEECGEEVSALLEEFKSNNDRTGD